MREIRFRGKEHTGDWITGGYVHKNGAPHIMAHIVDRGVDEWRAIPVIPATVGQFTGLRDENEKDIYEGDILADEGSGHVYVIAWIFGGPALLTDKEYLNMMDGSLAILWDALADQQTGRFVTECLQVINSVHDAPELLEC